MSYKLSQQANADLSAILTHGIRTFGEPSADQYFDGLIRQFEDLAYNPLLYRERKEIDPPIRLCPYGVHVIIYKVDNDGLFIIRVRHGQENWKDEQTGQNDD